MSLNLINPFQKFASGGGDPPFWEELDRVTLGSAGDLIDTGTFDKKENLMLLYHILKSGDARTDKLRFNADVGSNYARRISDNGGSDSTNVNQTGIEDTTSSSGEEFTVAYVSNTADWEKLGVSNCINQNSAGASVPRSLENYYKWANNSDQINQVSLLNEQSGSFNTGSELVVLGMNNSGNGSSKWQLLDSTTASGSDTNLTSSTFDPKKYLLIQAYGVADSTIDDTGWQFGTGGSLDTGSNYARRFNFNNGSQDASSGQVYIRFAEGSGRGGEIFAEAFVINTSGNEKLAITHASRNYSTGSGSPPNWFENYGKWTDTSGQINIVNLRNSLSNNFTNDSWIKVWGFD